MKYFWIRIATTLADSVLPLANHIMHQIPYLRKHWSTKRSKEGRELKHFPYKRIYVYTPMTYMHHSVCSLLLVCSVQIWYGQCWIWAKSKLKYWNIEIWAKSMLKYWNYLSVPCLLLIKACTHKNVKIKKSETAKPTEKHSWRFPPKSIVQAETLKRLNFRFLTFLLISCPIESFKSKLGPSAFIPYVAKSQNWQNIKVSLFC